VQFLATHQLPIIHGPRAKLERLCRYVSRPPLAVDRLALTTSGQVRYKLKTPYRDSNAHRAGTAGRTGTAGSVGAAVTPEEEGVGRQSGVFESTIRLIPSTRTILRAVIESLQTAVLPHMEPAAIQAASLRACLMLLTHA
jgi:Putative transposase